MLYQLKNLSTDQRFLIVFFILSVLLSFAYGYAVFSYVQVEICKSPIELLDLQA